MIKRELKIANKTEEHNIANQYTQDQQLSYYPFQIEIFRSDQPTEIQTGNI